MKCCCLQPNEHCEFCQYCMSRNVYEPVTLLCDIHGRIHKHQDRDSFTAHPQEVAQLKMPLHVSFPAWPPALCLARARGWERTRNRKRANKRVKELKGFRKFFLKWHNVFTPLNKRSYIYLLASKGIVSAWRQCNREKQQQWSETIVIYRI